MKRGIIYTVLFILLISASYAQLTTGRVAEGTNVQITLLNQNPDPVQPGRYVELRFRVENLGTYKTEDIKFEIAPDYPFTLDPGESAVRELGTLYGRATGDESATVYYKLRVDSDAVEGENEIRLMYTTDGGMNWASKDFDVRIQTIDASVQIKNIQSQRVRPGQVTTLSVELENMADSLLEDVSLKLELDSDDMPFVPINSSSEKKTKTLEAGESTVFDFRVLVQGNAESKVYKVPITIGYVDESSSLYTKEDILALDVGCMPQIDASIDSQTIYQSGQGGELSVKFVNRDVSDIKFLNVELLENDNIDVFSNPTVYVGDLDSDDYELADFQVYVKETEQQSVTIPFRVEYTDTKNNVYTEEIDLELSFYSDAELQQFGVQSRSPIVGIVIVVVIVVAGYLIYRKLR